MPGCSGDTGVMEPDRLFLMTLQDLQERLSNLDEYGMLRTAGLLRQLLLDEPRLVDLVNRKFRLRIRFAVADRRDYMDIIIADGAVFYSVEDGLDPETGRPGNRVVLGRDKFLKWPV